MDKMKIVSVIVRNVSMQKDLFDLLCRYLKDMDRLSIDYSMVSDFDEQKERPYWKSCSCYADEEWRVEAKLWDANRIIDIFCGINHVERESVEVDALELGGD